MSNYTPDAARAAGERRIVKCQRHEGCPGWDVEEYSGGRWQRHPKLLCLNVADARLVAFGGAAVAALERYVKEDVCSCSAGGYLGEYPCEMCQGLAALARVRPEPEKYGEKFDPRDVAILGGDPSL